MLIWKRTVHFGKSKHITQISLSGNSVSISGVIIGPRGGGVQGAVGLTVDEWDEIRRLIDRLQDCPLIKETRE